MYYLTNNQYQPNYDLIESGLPIIFLGFHIKSELDSDINIPNKYNPIYFKHYSRINGDIYKDHYYYGITLLNKSKYQNLITILDKISFNNDIITLEAYKNLLKRYNLTCDDCYRNFTIGSYPIDTKHLSAFVDTNCQKIIDDFYNIDKECNLAGLHLNIITRYPSFKYNFKILELE